MADLEQLEILKRGPSEWNTWRRSNPRASIDLSDVVLHETNVPWREGELVQLNLEAVDLRQANLERTILKGANLRRADLSGAKLRYANLRKADLSGAILRGALLNCTNLTLAILCGADLTSALFWETVIARTDLSGAVGLQDSRHGGPSIIDHRTVRRSGNLPIEFLRGIGLPDNLIDQMKASPRSSCSDCFISYSSSDQLFAERLYQDLQSAGVRCWYAPKDLRVGARTRQSLDDAIRSTERLIVILSSKSIESTWVEKEVETAFEEERRRNSDILLPVRIDDAVMDCKAAWASDIRITRNIGDFREWPVNLTAYREALRRLLEALKLA
jgi:hypothetical protein